MDLRLKGKTALVTGASSGLGYATALGLAKEGCNLVINSRNDERIRQAADEIRRDTGAEVLPLAADMTNPGTPQKLISKTLEQFGQLDLLVTNSGGPPPGSFESFVEEDWQHAIELSFMSHVRLIRAALPSLRQSEAASVLTVTSVTVKQPIKNLVLSNSIRTATAGLTKSLALELGPEQIRFNSILPSWTDTDRVAQLMHNRAKANNSSVEIEMKKQAAETALGRMGTPEEFSNVAVFLLSPAASYLTGVMLTFDGGSYKGTF